MMARADKDSDPKVREEALYWLVRLNADYASDTDRAQHAAWLAKAPAHRQEYVRLAGIWSDLDGIGDMPLPVAKPTYTRRGFIAAGALAASVAALATLTDLPTLLTSDYQTATGELRSIVLPDGSIVQLDAGSALSVDYSQWNRELVLHQGRAFFDVAKDAHRPFVVGSAALTTSALGTQFVVHRWRDAITVSVQESAVSVNLPGEQKQVVRAGESISFENGHLSDIRQAEADTGAAWRLGRLVFEDRPLGQVIADVNRYRRGYIHITDAALLSLPVSGIFNIRDPDRILTMIHQTLPVRVNELTPYLVLLRPA